MNKNQAIRKLRSLPPMATVGRFMTDNQWAERQKLIDIVETHVKDFAYEADRDALIPEALKFAADTCHINKEKSPHEYQQDVSKRFLARMTELAMPLLRG